MSKEDVSPNPIVAHYARIRLVQFAVAELILILGTYLIFGQFPAELVIPVSLSLIVPILFSEPYFTGPKSALVTSISTIASYFASDRSALWLGLLIFSIVIAICAVIAIDRKQKAGQVFHWISTRLGRATVIGTIATVVAALQIAHSDAANLQPVVIILVIVFLIVFLDWAKLFFNSSNTKVKIATINALIAPNQLLIGTLGNFFVGDRVRVVTQKSSSLGYVAEDLASDSGRQFRVVLDKHLSKITDSSNVPCVVTTIDNEQRKIMGFAIEGSTESTIHISPSRKLALGDTLELGNEENTLLYQVIGLNLEEENWSGGAAIVPRGKLIQIGCLSAEGRIVVRPTLPEPYAKIFSADDVSTTLNDDYMKIGTLKGTSIPVGIKKDWTSNNGHLAVLGMSGMGKTTSSAKLTKLAKDDELFIILDETSEYRTRLGFTPTLIGSIDMNAPGVFVTEPGGELPLVSKDLIKKAMAAANAEYQRNETPRRRYILLEEAHGYLPEWNFTSNRNHGEYVNESARYILQARKFNISFIMVSQRTAVISKSALSQCENYMILRTLDQTSLEYVEGIVGHDLKKLIPELGRYEAVCVGPIFNSDSPVIVSLDPSLVP